jgi:arylsulfatase A-like enzyme
VSTNLIATPREVAPLASRSIFILATWFGIATGLVEGAGLLLFQRINWAGWGFMVHVSPKIVWIAALVDAIFFVLFIPPLVLVARLVRREIALRVAVFLFAALASYDWLTLTARLQHRACLVLAIGVGAAFSRWVMRREAAVLRFWEKSLPLVIAIALLAAAGIEGGNWLRERTMEARLPQPAPDAPNVVIIVVDTLRADHVGAYGYSRPTTPTIDRMAREGALFENAVATCSWSLPSHVSLLTGRYEFEHGIDNVKPQPWLSLLNPRLGPYPTLGEVLGQRGYRTGGFSANRVYFSRDLGFGQSFVHFEDYFYSPSDMFVRTVLGRELVRHYMYRSENSKAKRLLRWLGLNSFMDHDDEGAAGYGGPYALRKRAEVVNQETLRWIDNDRRRPFLAFLNYFDVHTTYGGPPAYPKPAWPQDRLQDQYDDSVKYVDDNIGRLLAELEQRGRMRNTLVVITSDHGESLEQHGLATHGKVLYREVIQVPLVFWYPGHIPAGMRLDTMISNAAIPATVMEILGAKGQSDFPARGLTALWEDAKAGRDWPPPLSELAQNKYAAKTDKDADRRVMTASDGPMKSLMTARWHLIVHKKLGDQLYDWRQDPGESKNLIGTVAGREAAVPLLSRMEDVLAKQGSREAGHHALALVEQKDNFEEQRHGSPPGQPLNDYYRLAAEAGNRVTIGVRARGLSPSSKLDSVITIEDEQGKLYESCRDPGDDHIPPPGVPDATPDAYDDVCRNDDLIPGVDTDSKLEMLVPGAMGSSVTLYIRISDWNGAVGPDMGYQISVVSRPASEVLRVDKPGGGSNR